MEIFKEIINLLNVIAWPLVVLSLGITFKKSINDILNRLRGAKYKDIEIDFQQKLIESEEIIAKANAENHQLPIKATAMSTDFLNNIKNLSEVSPRSLIIESWLQLETVINNLSKENFQGSPKQILNINSLVDNKIIDKNDMDVYKNIRNMRNNVLHNYDFKIRSNEAIEYALLVYRLMENIKNKVKKNA